MGFPFANTVADPAAMERGAAMDDGPIGHDPDSVSPTLATPDISIPS
jgi:hypothetical protein